MTEDHSKKSSGVNTETADKVDKSTNKSPDKSTNKGADKTEDKSNDVAVANTDKKPSASTEVKSEETGKASPADTAKDTTASKNQTVTKKESTSSVKKKTPPPATPTASTGKKLLSWLFGILWLLVVIALAVGAWFGWQLWQEQDRRVAKLETQLEKQTQKQAAEFASSLSQQASLLEAQQQRLEAFSAMLEKDQRLLQQRLDAHAQRLQTLTGSSRDNWMLEEVRYLLRLANQRQVTGGGGAGIVGLLESADKLLRELDLPDVFPLRDSIRKDILAIQVAPKVDREGLYLQLSAVVSHLYSLPPVPLRQSIETRPANAESTANEPAATEPVTEKSVGSHWQDGLFENIKEAFGTLDQYFRIDTYDKPIEPILSKSQQRLMAQNLRLMMEQAQVALLREEQEIYRASLSKVIMWLNTHYSHYTEKEALIEQLEVLQQQNIVTKLPTISASLLRLNDYIRQRDALEPSSSSTNNNTENNTAADKSKKTDKETAL